jgi:serine/threonine protein kinase
VVTHVNGKDIVKLADFGVTKVIEKQQGEHNLATMYLTTVCGTAMYMAPEFFSENVKYTRSVDIFALGLVLKVILQYSLKHKTLTPIFKDKNRPFGQTLVYAHNNNLEEPTIVIVGEHDNVIVKGIKETIIKMTCFDSKERCQIFEVTVDLDQYIESLQHSNTSMEYLTQDVSYLTCDDEFIDDLDDDTFCNTQIQQSRSLNYDSYSLTLADIKLQHSSTKNTNK